MEQLLIKKIEAGIRGLRFGTKTPSEIEDEITKYLERLKQCNAGMAEELYQRYRNAIKDFNFKNQVK